MWTAVSGARTVSKPRLRLGHRDAVYAVGFMPDGAGAVTGSFDRELRLWRVEDGALLQTMSGHDDKIDSLAITSPGRPHRLGRRFRRDPAVGRSGGQVPENACPEWQQARSSQLLPRWQTAAVRFRRAKPDCHVYNTAPGAAGSSAMAGMKSPSTPRRSAPMDAGLRPGEALATKSIFGICKPAHGARVWTASRSPSTERGMPCELLASQAMAARSAGAT